MCAVPSHPIPWDDSHGNPMGIPFQWTSLQRLLGTLYRSVSPGDPTGADRTGVYRARLRMDVDPNLEPDFNYTLNQNRKLVEYLL